MSKRELEEVTTIKRMKTVCTCDLCGRGGLCTVHECFICGRDICSECYIYMPDDEKMWHEYEHCCCKECWEAGNVHRNAMDVEEYKFRQMFESEIAEWKHDVIGDLYGN